ncbi:MAG TPA: MXAN_6640 family putative metalloprotease [Actinomycetota bacterium]|nr:MXAN_6640 family putative metalloprotease [Actinomycetota bacterium]
MRQPARMLAILLAVGAMVTVVPGGAVAAGPDAGPTLPALARGPRDGLTRALEQGRIGPARYALERFAAAVAPASVPAAFGQVAAPDPRSGTQLARDLLLRMGALAPRQRARAAALLDRPTDGPNDPDTPIGADVGYAVSEAPPECDPDVCVHYVTTTANKVPTLDAGGEVGVPDYVETVAGVMADVWAFEVDDLGYRPPKPDGTSDDDGGGTELDVYLTNLGDDGLYGYCTSDDPRLFSGYRYFDFSAYCVLDNDFSALEFGYPDTTLPLRVTAAHEFFHAVQFAYDLYEDGWFMEATATWIEDEVYDEIDDNRQYLNASPISNPTVPLDKTVGFRVYGDWIFFRFLSESLGTGGLDDRVVVRKIWERADGSQVGPDQFSSQAVRTVLDNETKDGNPWTFAKAFRDFGAWNAAPDAFYSEGDAYDAATAQVSKTVTPRSSPVKNTGQLDHLAHRLVRFVRGNAVGGGARLRVTVDGSDGATSPVATLVIVADGGAISTRAITLNGKGVGRATVDYGNGVRRVIAVLGSASVRYTGCYDFFGPFACNGGDPKDDGLSFKVTAKLV